MNFTELTPVLEKYKYDYAGNLIPILQDAQDLYGWLSTELLEYVSEKTGVAEAKIMGVVSFYAQFRTKPVGKNLILLCQGTACHVNGSSEIERHIREYLQVDEGEVTPDGLFTYNNVACLGCCSLSPVMTVNGKAYGHLTGKSAVEVLKKIQKHGGEVQSDEKPVLGNCSCKSACAKASKADKVKIAVGMGSCGIAAGADKVYETLKTALDGKADVQLTGCNGNCYCEPIVTVGERTFGKVDDKAANEIVKLVCGQENRASKYELVADEETSQSAQRKVALRNCGLIDPANIDDYIAVGGYRAAEKCKTMTSDEIIEEVKRSGLAGRGGAGFPTWFKWNAAKNSSGEKKYLICNADEGDPGAFMDRAILEGDPHSVIEGMIIAAKAIGAAEGIVYVRAEYPLAIERLQTALEQAFERGYLNDEFGIRIKAGAGAFVCGEETALIASLEGERGMPRLKPPFPAQKGYKGAPSNINNVETFANVPWILENGGDAFVNIGEKAVESKGTKVFALTGKVAKGGLAEIPMGRTVSDVVYGCGGGLAGGKQLKAVQLGGPSGGCIPYDLIATEIDYKALAATGAIMGSGGMVVMDDTSCMVDMARYFLDFTCKESCGKCTPCRVGNKRMLEILERICRGEGKEGDIELLEELGEGIKVGSLCALGQTAPNPVLSTIKYFRKEYEDHIGINGAKRCTATQCREMLTYRIINRKCVNCILCRRVCPSGAVVDGEFSLKGKSLPRIDMDKCVRCGQCVTACRLKAIEVF